MRSCIGWRRLLFLTPLVFIVLHLLSVSELHRDASRDDLPNKRNKKFDHLVIGPAAGQGLPNRLQCQGTKALNKTHLPSSNLSYKGDSVAFVTVFTVYNTSLDSHPDGRSVNLIKVGNASYSKTERSMAILNVFINFIQKSMPQSNVIILTDPASDLSIRRNRVTVMPIKGEYSRDKLMLQRIRSYIVRANRINRPFLR